MTVLVHSSCAKSNSKLLDLLTTENAVNMELGTLMFAQHLDSEVFWNSWMHTLSTCCSLQER